MNSMLRPPGMIKLRTSSDLYAINRPIVVNLKKLRAVVGIEPGSLPPRLQIRAKAGVMLLDLQSDTVQQGELNLEEDDAPDRGRLMSTLDKFPWLHHPLESGCTHT